MSLVANDALETEETLQAVESFHTARRAAVETLEGSEETPAERAARLDVSTGIALLILSAVLVAGSYAVAVSMGGGKYFVAFGPAIYGVFRLMRGLDARKALPKPPTPKV